MKDFKATEIWQNPESQQNYLKNGDLMSYMFQMARTVIAMTAESILELNKADFIGMGRGSLADSDLPNKAKAGDLTSIRYCIGCLQGHCIMADLSLVQLIKNYPFPNKIIYSNFLKYPSVGLAEYTQGEFLPFKVDVGITRKMIIKPRSINILILYTSLKQKMGKRHMMLLLQKCIIQMK